MSTLKIAVEATDVTALVRSGTGPVVVHAYDVEDAGRPFRFHEAPQKMTYDVRPDIEWASSDLALPGPRCAQCKEGSDGGRRP
ncbi:hypothetical protein [Streptomyces sp. SID8499]|uniref:hypothetical protein n=1 Tax=Streptomyces sp. SID8499 TaxID=2706106 RepID=UPI0013CA4474|nr:hypothetical protein [Streptomyces sp. SID8499]NED35162.1 hypothetical protein [Streptomyces sp. SID8499]